MRQSKDPSVFTALFEDTAALLGLLIAFTGITAAAYFERPELDGVATILIGIVLAATRCFCERLAHIGWALHAEAERQTDRDTDADRTARR